MADKKGQAVKMNPVAVKYISNNVYIVNAGLQWKCEKGKPTL